MDLCCHGPRYQAGTYATVSVSAQARTHAPSSTICQNGSPAASNSHLKGLEQCIDATEQAFGTNVDYGQIVKSYETESIGAGRYSPPHVVICESNPHELAIRPSPVSALATSSASDLTMRMHMRRFTRLTNGFSWRG